MSLFIAVLAGAVIGYGTNWLAIKMLFWPREPRFVLGKQVPLTPGLFVRRRGDFSAAIAELIEQRFTDAEDIRSLVIQAQSTGALLSAVKDLGPVVHFVFRAYSARTTPESFRRDCKLLARALEQGRVVRKMVKAKIDNMPTDEIEEMILTVVRKELNVITYLGGFIGAAIGALQGMLA